jgi:hypothetical protein
MTVRTFALGLGTVEELLGLLDQLPLAPLSSLYLTPWKVRQGHAQL